MLIDYTKISDEQTIYELLPEGLRTMTVTEAEQKTSNKGNIFWALTLQDFEENKIFDNIYFTKKTLNSVKRYMKILGLDVDGAYDYKPKDIIGCSFNAYLLIEDYTDKNGKDKQRNSVDIWNSEPYTTTQEEIKELTSIPF